MAGRAASRRRIRPLADRYRDLVVRTYGPERGERSPRTSRRSRSRNTAHRWTHTARTRLFPFLPAGSSAGSPFTRKDWVDMPEAESGTMINLVVNRVGTPNRKWTCRDCSISMAVFVGIVIGSSSCLPLVGRRASRAEPVRPRAVIRLFNGKDLTGLTTWLKDTKHDDPRQVFRVDGRRAPHHRRRLRLRRHATRSIAIIT